MPAMDERAASSAAPAYITQWQQYFPQEKELVSIQNMYVNTEEGYYFLMPSSWLETVTGALEAGERQFIFSEWVVNDEGVGASGAVILKIGVFTKANWDAHILSLIHIWTVNKRRRLPGAKRRLAWSGQSALRVL